MSDDSKAEAFEVTCPCCAASIAVDRLTGIVLHHREAASAPNAGSIGDILNSLDAKRESTERLFKQEMSAVKDRGRLLDEKLQEALKRARETKDEKLIRPIDLE